VAGVVVVAAAAVTAAAVTGRFGPPGNRGTSNLYPASTAVVTSRSLSSQTQVDATLGMAGSYTVVNQAQGTLTELPSVGQVVRQGQVLYQVNGTPVVLLDGHTPAWRDLSEGSAGSDVTELNADLVKLGYATDAELSPSSDYFGAETATALEGLQAHLGLPVTGTLPLGQAVFEPTAIQVTGLDQSVMLGGTVAAGSALLTATSTTPVVTTGLDPAQQTLVKVGDTVTVTLPDGSTTPGTISSIATVATSSSGSGSSGSGSSGSGNSGSGNSGGSDGSSGSSATIAVEVTLTHPKAAAGLDQAPVQVTITTATVRNALVVPVSALLAQASGGYAVEVTGPGGHHLERASTGLFDDADGLVQVTGSGLSAGQRVVVPGS
jgi:hypothetical protein